MTARGGVKPALVRVKPPTTTPPELLLLELTDALDASEESELLELDAALEPSEPETDEPEAELLDTELTTPEELVPDCALDDVVLVDALALIPDVVLEMELEAVACPELLVLPTLLPVDTVAFDDVDVVLAERLVEAELLSPSTDGRAIHFPPTH